MLRAPKGRLEAPVTFQRSTQSLPFPVRRVHSEAQSEIRHEMTQPVTVRDGEAFLQPVRKSYAACTGPRDSQIRTAEIGICQRGAGGTGSP